MFSIARLKNWLGYNNLTYSDLNAEFNNLISKAGADTLSGANSTNGSAPTVASMQASSNPGGVGTENLSTTVQQDIQQLRYMLQEITGQTYWYSNPPTNIGSLSAALQNPPQSRIISGRTDSNSLSQPMFLVPDGTAATIRLKAASTNFSAYFNNSLQTFSADIALTSLATAPATNNTCAVNDSTLSGGQSTKTQGEFGTFLNIGTIGSAITALNGTYAAFKISTEYFIAEVDTTNNRLKNCFRGVGFNTSDTWAARVAVSNTNTITLMKLTWVFATYNSTTPGLAITYNKPTISYLQPSGPAIGDYWYDLTNNTWKTYSGSSFVATVAVLAGICIQDGTACQVARSSDFYNVFSRDNTIDLEWVSNTQVRSIRKDQRCNVYGETFYFNNTHLVWDTSTTLDTGESLSASTTYYTYVTNLGDLKTTTVSPSDRKYDLLGQYHPQKPWRCIGQFATDGSSHIKTTGFLITNDFVTPNTSALVQSSSTGSFTTTSSSYVNITNASVTIQTYGKPVVIFLQPASTSLAEISLQFSGTSCNAEIQLDRDGSAIATFEISWALPSNNNIISNPPSMVFYIDNPPAGLHTYLLQGQVSVNATQTLAVTNCTLVAYAPYI